MTQKNIRFKGKKILLLGSGGLRIGQAGEFDYSGSQAIKAIKEEGIRCILVNPNIATVQTDDQLADVLYLQPLQVPFVKKIIEKERPDGILLGFGGQTALNLGLQLEKAGILKKNKVQVLGTSVESIRLTEDRDLFKKSLASIGIKCPKSLVAKTVKEALAAAKEIGYPIMLRSGFSLGGLGSGKIDSPKDLEIKALSALSGSPQILIEEYLVGWKEIEYEIVRDAYDNAVTVCNMENMDPMGVHTGESIVVAPSQTLNNREYHLLRNIAIEAARHFKITGECNIQYALNPRNGDYRVIEMNARLSRSSALASKATGYPLAFVAAKLALGYGLFEIQNAVTKKTSAFFEPALDYVVVKIPRWDIQKFRSAERRIGTEMKSVGEVMGIGRSFPEALQKAIRMLNIGASGLTDYPYPIPDPKSEIAHPTDRRLFAIYSFLKKGAGVKEAHALSHIDLWFLHHILAILQIEKKLAKNPLSKELLWEAKRAGFSDKAIADLKKKPLPHIRMLRLKLGITPYIKQIDTLAGEFAAKTNYLYLTYHAQEHDIKRSSVQPVIVLGSGPYCIGSSVEFDWCAVNTARTLKQLKETAVLVNSNPETVSTDYDESDRLYFEELTLERIMDIADFEKTKGIIVSVGGQIANNLAVWLDKAGYPILGTKASSIDMAEDRKKFSSLLSHLGIDQPAWQTVSSLESAKKFAGKVGFPLLIRPSYVLSGSAMNVVFNEKELEKYLQEASLISPKHPVVISQFISDAKELEIDGVAKEGAILVEAITEHIENAGVHSGDATVVLPPQRLYLETIRRTKKITRDIVQALCITGPFNIQFIAKNNAIQVIECNVRASRSFPFVSKITNHNFIQIAIQALLGKYKKAFFETLELDYVGVKTPQFSYQRLKGANPVANVEMNSTGEVACLGGDLLEAFLSSWLSTEQPLPKKRILVSIGGDKKSKLLEPLKQLDEKNWEIYATEGTHDFLLEHGVASVCLYKASENIEPNITTIIKNKKVDLIVNIPRGTGTNTQTDGFTIRRLAIDYHTPLITNLQIAQIFLHCLTEMPIEKIQIKSWQEFIKREQHNEL
jgi:carbamoyl-phosphate synthase large subunit